MSETTVSGVLTGLSLLGWVGLVAIVFMVWRSVPKRPKATPLDALKVAHVREMAEAGAIFKQQLEQETRMWAEQARLRGVQYTLNRPPVPPLFRVICEPLLDTFRIPEGMGPFSDLSLFGDNKKFPDGRGKVHGIDTNMTQCGQLGFPYEADLICWGVRFDGEVSGPDMLAVLANLRLRLLFGNRAPDDPKYIASQLAGSELYPVLIVTDGRTHMAMGPPALRDMIGELSDDKYERFMAKLESYLRIFGGAGLWRNWGRGLAIEGQRPYHLDSTTAFRVEAAYWGPPLSREVTVRIMLRVNKYVPIP